MAVSFIFPGQGSQYVGMGKELYETFTVAKEVFQEVDDVLEAALSKIIFEGPEELLKQTRYAQPAIMATSIAFFEVLKKEFGFSSYHLSAVAGHSLGEYSALIAAEAFSLSVGASLLKVRGEAMQMAVPEGKGAMAALIGLSLEACQKVVQKAQSEGEICQVANDNAPGQVVISGSTEGIERAAKWAKELGAKRVMPLSVSGPFHSQLMESAAQKLALALVDVHISEPIVPVASNVSAALETNPLRIKSLLVDQICSSVRWRESIEELIKINSEALVEIGPGQVLSKLVKRMNPEVSTLSVNSIKSLETFAEEYL